MADPVNIIPPHMAWQLLPLRVVTLMIATQQVGVEEVGENWGPEVKMYLEAAGIFRPAAWCAAFVNWCAQKASHLTGQPSPLEEVPWQAYVQSYYEHGKQQGWRVPHHLAQPGDLFLLYFPHLSRWAHIGFVTQLRLGEKRIMTLEGNTNEEGLREGLYVMPRRRRLADNLCIMRWTA